MSLATVFLLDSAHRGLGGINSLNQDLLKSPLSFKYEFYRSGWGDIWGFYNRVPKGSGTVIFVLDEVVTWSKIPKLFRLRRAAKKWARRYDHKVSFILREHHYSEGFTRHCVRSKKRFNLMLRVAYGLMDTVIAVSACQARWMEEERLCGREKIFHLPHAVDLSSLLLLDLPNSAICRQRTFLMDSGRNGGHKGFVFGAMGRLEYQKGLDLLIQAWVCFEERDDVILLIAGDGGDRERLQEIAHPFKTIRFVGKVSDPSWFFAQCDCIVLPSRYEPFGQVCLESRAAGRPVVVSSVDGLPEQVAGEYGRIFPEGDVGALSGHLMAMVILKERSPNEFDSMAVHARRSAESCWEQFIDGFRMFLGQITEGNDRTNEAGKEGGDRSFEKE